MVGDNSRDPVLRLLDIAHVDMAASQLGGIASQHFLNGSSFFPLGQLLKHFWMLRELRLSFRGLGIEGVCKFVERKKGEREREREREREIILET